MKGSSLTNEAISQYDTIDENSVPCCRNSISTDENFGPGICILLNLKFSK